ncbi:MAG: polyprenyl synthetase family protein [Bacteroidetes bacterium]|nr:polyprenyl synthetase family protein [Bacteroidota bacterium]
MLESIKEKYEQYLSGNHFAGKPEKLYDSMNYIMSIGGKRIRPILTLLGAKIAGGEMDKALPLAHAMEVFHNFTLVHDDIMDEAPTRRGKSTLHIKENTATAILTGDNMVIASFDIILQTELPNKIQILKTLTQTAKEVCEGQQMDMDFEKMTHVGLEQYIEMIRLKTAVLLGCCLKCGSLSADASLEISETLYDFGVNTGIAFQIMDDYLDCYGNPELTGKQLGGDILSAKKTALYNLAWDKADTEQRQNLSEWFNKTQTNEGERLQHTMQLFEELGIARSGKDLMELYFSKAKDLLEKSTITNYQPLLEMINFLRSREK